MIKRSQPLGPQVSELYFYPIKSLRGLKTDTLHLDSQGPLYDRQWMIVDGKNQALTQRQYPQLVKVGVRMEADASLELSLDGFGNIDFGINEHSGLVEDVTIWKDQVRAQEVSSEVSGFLSEFLKSKVRLVKMESSAQRTLPDQNWTKRSVRFVDQKPLLVIGRESLRDLERRAKVTLSMSRFRPNIVIDQTLPYAEDMSAIIDAGGVRLHGLKPCSRCKVTTVHPLTGVVGEEPLKTLSSYRRQESGVTFGYYFIHEAPGFIKIGAPVSLH